MDWLLRRKSDVGANPTPVKASKCVMRKYDPEYIKFGIIMADSDVEVKAVF